MTTRGTFTIKGLGGYLETLVKDGVDVDQIVANYLIDAAPIAQTEIEDQLKLVSATWTGGTAKTIAASSVQQEGNYHYIELSVGGQQGLGARPMEYGNTRQAAKPFLRLAFRRLRRYKLKQMMKAVLEKFGLPTT